MQNHSYSVKKVSFHLLKKALLLSICTENMIVLSRSRIMSATYAIKTFSIKEVLAMHMHKERYGAAHVQKPCDMCLITCHMPHVLKNHIGRTHLGILKTF